MRVSDYSQHWGPSPSSEWADLKVGVAMAATTETSVCLRVGMDVSLLADGQAVPVPESTQLTVSLGQRCEFSALSVSALF